MMIPEYPRGRRGDGAVDEATWHTSTRLYELLGYLGERLSDRKRRLFAVACCRRFAHQLDDPRSRHALDVAERYARGQAGEPERLLAEEDAFEAHVQMRESRRDPCSPVVWSRQAELLTHSTALTLTRGIFYAQDAADYSRWSLSAAGRGYRTEEDEEAVQCRLLREIVGSPFWRVTVEPAWRQYNDGAAYHLAHWIDEQGDHDSLPILGDALEEAGCTDEVLLAHCREPGGHLRGCWVVDLVLGLDGGSTGGNDSCPKNR
jgi:hypothetical protein